jgi:hypothetical protein
MLVPRGSGAAGWGGALGPLDLEGSDMGQMLIIVGGVIVVIGAGLWIGNVTGKFVSFPFAGYITMGIGGAIVAFGKKKQAEEAAGRLNPAPQK